MIDAVKSVAELLAARGRQRGFLMVGEVPTGTRGCRRTGLSHSRRSSLRSGKRASTFARSRRMRFLTPRCRVTSLSTSPIRCGCISRR